MKKIEFKEGDLFFINDIELIGKTENKTLSFGNEKRVGKLIYISSLFKGMIGFLPSKETFSTPPQNIQEIEFTKTVIYTDYIELKNGNWNIIGHQDTTNAESLLTTRRVANAIMIKDDEIRICTEDDYKKYKNQSIAGLGAVYYLLMNLPK